MTEEQTFALIRAAISSVWDLELLLLLHRTPERQWTVDELVRELRASPTVIAGAAARLCAQKFAEEISKGTIHYLPADEPRREFVQSLEQLYGSKPASVIKEIMSRTYDELRSFSDAFRLRD